MNVWFQCVCVCVCVCVDVWTISTQITIEYLEPWMEIRKIIKRLFKKEEKETTLPLVFNRKNLLT